MLVLAAIIFAAAALVGRAQIGAFRKGRSRDESDLFVYTSRRLRIRVAGCVLLAAVALTLAWWELGAPLSAVNAQRIVLLLLAEVVLLLVVAGLDLRETTRSSRL